MDWSFKTEPVLDIVHEAWFKEIPNYVVIHFSILNHYYMMKFIALLSRGLERKLISIFESHF